jgi:alpha-glucosidase (family GH31 glycosyl hydrolase)
MPIYVRMGAIIPMQPDMDYVDQKPADPLTLDIYPLGATEYELYEDDGVSRDYLKGVNAITKIACKQEGPTVTVTIEPPKGPYAPKVKDRKYRLQVMSGKPKSVKVSGRKAEWTYEPNQGKVLIALPAITKSTSIVIE